ncbi:MAG: glycoside hydrolase family 2 TIM barrel-domain containing protein [Limisphaerales bacterium]
MKPKTISLFILYAFIVTANARGVIDFDEGWLFFKGQAATAMMPAFDDSSWRKVNLPHDWSIEGPLSPDYGSGNGYAPGGIGWYRKHFVVDSNATNKTVAVEFDGIYDNSEVWINGQFAGGRPYGFSSFRVDLTPFINFGSSDNLIAVRVDHSRYADSRYYTGSGIYRNVRLIVEDKLRIAHWGIVIATPRVSEAGAIVRVATTVENCSAGPKNFFLISKILAPDGETVASETVSARVRRNSNKVITRSLKVLKPELWSLNSPSLYVLRSAVRAGNSICDETETSFGIRDFKFDPDKGFFLNGAHTWIKGVCLHHDAGPLGAAVPPQVWERRLKALKVIGVNAIRTSHNPPDPALLDLCDRLGFLVMDEAFDEFTPSKNKWVSGRNIGTPSHFGYGEFFARWAVTDIQDMVRRDRNHPGIILWSIGNEIDYANDPFSDPVLGDDYQPHNPPATDLVKYAAPLVTAVKHFDKTRPVTAALATVRMSDAVHLPELLDVVGYNYQEGRYQTDHRAYPRRVIYGSENKHSYAAWLAVETNAFIAGQFLWTGADYLGEAGPWPNRASGPGLLDLCGFKKPLGWFRQSLWSDKPMVYLCALSGYGIRYAAESWNWPSNSLVKVLCFANCAQVALTLNGHPLGTKYRAGAMNGILSWEIPFQPGILKALGKDQAGRNLCSFSLQTAADPYRIELLPDTNEIQANGKDVCQVEFRVVDKNGARAPDATNEITFEMSGPAHFLGIGNGDLNDLENPKTNVHRAFQGRGLAILQADSVPGDITITAAGAGLAPGSITVRSD